MRRWSWWHHQFWRMIPGYQYKMWFQQDHLHTVFISNVNHANFQVNLEWFLHRFRFRKLSSFALWNHFAHFENSNTFAWWDELNKFIGFFSCWCSILGLLRGSWMNERKILRGIWTLRTIPWRVASPSSQSTIFLKKVRKIVLPNTKKVALPKTLGNSQQGRQRQSVQRKTWTPSSRSKAKEKCTQSSIVCFGSLKKM